jgi:RHS repeat-associated protein
LNLGFPGQYWDAESGLWHNGYRDYDYSSGRYLQSDPIGLGGGANTYTYVRGNPLNLVDPFGLVDLNLTAPWDPTHTAMSVIPHQDGVFSVGIHYDGTNFYGPAGQLMTAQQVAQAIANSPDFNGTDTIRMYSCRVGASIDNQTPAAQTIANSVPGVVQASNSWIFVGSTQGFLGTYRKDSNGGMDRSSPGQWIIFRPVP